METKWNYFQFRKNHQYPVYLRIQQDDLNTKCQHLFHELGFNELSELETKKIKINHSQTRILTVQNASLRLQQQINGSDLMDKYGLESISIQLGTPIYTYRKVGVMGVPTGRPLWELALQPGLSQTEHMVGLRIILVRYLSLALADKGVLPYWGTVKDGDIIMMKQGQSFGEAVFVDWEKKLIFSNGGETRISSHLHIIRKDVENKSARSMSREELISFLSVSTCLLSFQGISHTMKRAIFELSSQVKGSYAISESSLNL